MKILSVIRNSFLALSKFHKLLIVVIAAIVVIAGAVFGALSWKGQKNDGPNLNNQEVPLIEANPSIMPSLSVLPTKNTSSSSGGSTASNGQSGSAGGTSGSGAGAGSDAGTGSTPASAIFGSYSSTPIESIISSLSVISNDAIGDFYTPSSGAPPSGVYPYSPIDIDDFYLGTSDGRLFIKFSLDGTVPTSRTTVDSNTIERLTWDIIFDTDNNTNNGCFGSEKAAAFNIAYNASGQIWYNGYGWSSCSGGTYDGISPNISGLFHIYNDGIGKKSVVVSFALSDLGINLGDLLRVNFWSEVESNLWPHYSFDNGAWSAWVVN